MRQFSQHGLHFVQTFVFRHLTVSSVSPERSSNATEMNVALMICIRLLCHILYPQMTTFAAASCFMYFRLMKNISLVRNIRKNKVPQE